jgi:hypothetical protein
MTSVSLTTPWETRTEDLRKKVMDWAMIEVAAVWKTSNLFTPRKSFRTEDLRGRAID